MSNEQAIMDKFVAKSLEIIALKETNRELLKALQLAVRQNQCDMLMTGEELRKCEAAIDKALREPL